MSTDHRVDSYHETSRIALERLDERLEEDGWDQPPKLFLVMRGDEQLGGATFSAVAFMEMPGWDMILAMAGEPAAALDTFAATLETGQLQKVLPDMPKLYGVAFSAESWILKSRAKTLAEANRIAADRQIHRHPDRLEARAIILAPIIGEQLLLTRFRGDSVDVTPGPEGRFAKYLGRIASALATSPPSGGAS